MIKRSLVKRMNYVWSDDPALDKDASEFAEKWDQFKLDGDAKKLPLKEGEVVTIFELKPLHRKVFLRALSQTDPMDQFAEAFAHGVKGIAPCEIDGETLVVKFAKPGTEDERLAPEVLDKTFDPVLVCDVGARVMEISRINFQRG